MNKPSGSNVPGNRIPTFEMNGATLYPAELIEPTEKGVGMLVVNFELNP